MIDRRRFLALGVAGVATATLASLVGCGRSSDLTIGSKNFQEQWILSELLAELIRRKTGASARTKDLGGTFLVHKAITSGNIDAYVEYTGTAFTAVLKNKTIADRELVFQTVRDAYRSKYQLEWLPPLGFDNTFVLLVRRADADKHGLATISDLAKVTGSFRPGFGFEFYDRFDGYRNLVKAYGLEFSKHPKQMRLGLTYRAIDSNQVDLIAGNATDGLIRTLNLVALEDDKKFFPPYQAAPVIRASVLERRPKVRTAIESLGGKISTELMRNANFEVDGNKRKPKTVAIELLDKLQIG